MNAAQKKFVAFWTTPAPDGPLAGWTALEFGWAQVAECEDESAVAFVGDRLGNGFMIAQAKARLVDVELKLKQLAPTKRRGVK